MFLQTKLMSKHLKHHPYCVLVSISNSRNSKYGFYTVLFSSITIFGQTIALGIGYMNIKWIDSISWVFAKFMERWQILLKGKYPPVVVIPFEGDIIAASQNTFGNVSKLYTNQFYVYKSIKMLLKPYVKNENQNAKAVLLYCEKILAEKSQSKWELLQEKIVENLGFDKNVEKWFEKFFFGQKDLWKMTSKDKLFYTGGLHTFYRANLINTLCLN